MVSSYRRRKIQPTFPKNQHRPVILEIGTSVPIVSSVQRPRWNFEKGDWDKFQVKLDAAIRFISPVTEV